MTAALFVFICIAVAGFSFLGGWAARSARYKDEVAKRVEIERARFQGQIDHLKTKQDRPTIEPPSDYNTTDYFTKGGW